MLPIHSNTAAAAAATTATASGECLLLSPSTTLPRRAIAQPATVFSRRQPPCSADIKRLVLGPALVGPAMPSTRRRSCRQPYTHTHQSC